MGPPVPQYTAPSHLHCLLFPTNSHLTTGYSQCVCHSWDNKVRGARRKARRCRVCTRWEKGAKKTSSFQLSLFAQPTSTAIPKAQILTKKFQVLFSVLQPPCLRPVGVLASLRINQPPTHSPFTQLFLHFTFFISTFLHFYILVSSLQSKFIKRKHILPSLDSFLPPA